MKRFLPVAIIIVLALSAGICFKQLDAKPQQILSTIKKAAKVQNQNNEIQSGDMIFQSSYSGQSRAVQLATRSKYSHCGLIFKIGKDYVVYEAVQPVQITPLDEWIARGDGGHYAIKRLKNADEVLNAITLDKMKQVAEGFVGKNYDLTFEWSDDKIYCSELLWKVYKRATGIEVGKLEKLKDFDLSSEIVKQKIKERYGNNVPLNETVISPASIFASDLLMTVKDNY